MSAWLKKSLWLIPLALALAANIEVLHNGYGWDDQRIIRHFQDAGADLRLTQLLPSFGTADSPPSPFPYYRPLVSISYAVDYLLWGNNPFGFHFSVWVFNGINAVLVFFLARALIASSGRTSNVRRETSHLSPLTSHNFVPLIAASLFAVHPIHAEAVAWIAGRNDVLCTTFLLLCFIAYNGWGASGRKSLYAVSLLFFWLALLGKETAVAMIVMFPLIDYFLMDRNSAPANGQAQEPAPTESGEHKARPYSLLSTPYSRLLFRSIPPLLILGLFLMKRMGRVTGALAVPGVVSLNPEPAPIQLLTGLWAYLKMLVFPYPHNPFITALPAVPWAAAGSAAAVVSATAMIVWILRKQAVPAFGLAWTAASLAPAMAVTLLHLSVPPVAERYVYTPSAGFLIVASWLLVSGLEGLRSFGRARILRIAAFVGTAVLIGLWGIQNRTRDAVWKSPLSFWQAASAASPDSGFPHRQLGVLSLKRGRADEAENFFRLALALDEKRYGADHFLVANSLHDLADLAFARKKYGEAERLYQQAIAIRETALGPDHPVLAESLNNLGVLYRKRERYAESESLYQRALAIREKSLGPDSGAVATTLNNLAVLYQLQGRIDLAEANYRRSLEILERHGKPGRAEAVSTARNLASLLRSAGRADEAERLESRFKEDGTSADTGD